MKLLAENTEGRDFFVGDIHGCYQFLMQDALTGGDPTLWLMNGGEWIADEDCREVGAVVKEAMQRLPIAIEVPCHGKRIGVIHADVTSGQWGVFAEDRDVWSRTRLASFSDTAPVRGIDLVVVGHTILDEPERHANVLHIDTGAFHTGVLTLIEAKDLFA